MKRVTIIFLLFSINAYSQPKNIPINYQYFILGTIDDYGGRRVDSSNANWIDLYAPVEKALVHFTDSLLLKNKVGHKIVLDLESLYIISDSMAKNMNSFYDFKNIDERSQSSGTNLWDTLYSGRLKENIFHDSTEIYSFLFGVCMRFGQRSDSIYKIRLLNSFSKSRFCLDLLKKIGCSETNSEYVSTVPSQNIIYFKPTERLDEYLKALEILRSQLSKSNISLRQR
jgi:hypothetical protein